MTLQHLALSNMKGLQRKYAAFLFSSVVAVLVFYLLASFVLHPDVVNGYVAQAARVRQGLLVSQYIIVAFTFFFVLYSSWAFVKSRKKEFGLLCLLGATKGQVSRLVVIEHVVVGTISVAAGLGLGIPLSKLMLDAMSRFLQVSSPVRFMVVIPAVIWTVGLFMALFIFIGTFTTLQISPRRVVRLLREHQRPKTLPSYSLLVALLAFVCIGGGYAVAWNVDGMSLALAMLPVTFIVSFGTFLFFAQASVGILRMLQRKLSFFYRGLNLLTVGDLVFRMKENAWVLATVAVLSAGVITATGTIYTAQATMLRNAEHSYPHALTFVIDGSANASAVSTEIHSILSKHKVEIAEEVALSGLSAEVGGLAGGLVVSESIYNAWAAVAEREPVDLEGTEAALLQPYAGPTGEQVEGIPMEIRVGGDSSLVGGDSVGYDAVTVSAMSWPFPNTNYLQAVSQFVVVDDDLFERLATTATPGSPVSFFSLEFENWTKTYEASERVRAAIPDSSLIEFRSRMGFYEGRRQMSGLTAMIALFVTALFFIAAGSMLYFRLFGDIQEDREKYRSMRKLGVSEQEINRVITSQVLVIFFAPIVVGSVHCGFAMKALSNVLIKMDWPFLGVFGYALAAIAASSLVQAVYFMVARHAYVKEVRSAIS